jgi:hypothetical protein
MSMPSGGCGRWARMAGRLAGGWETEATGGSIGLVYSDGFAKQTDASEKGIGAGAPGRAPAVRPKSTHSIKKLTHSHLARASACELCGLSAQTKTQNGTSCLFKWQTPGTEMLQAVSCTAGILNDCLEAEAWLCPSGVEKQIQSGESSA